MRNKNDLTSMVNMLMQDSIFIPKTLMFREDISEDTKIIFSTVLTNSLATNINGFKSNIKSLQISDIQNECCCNIKTAKKIKKELLSLLPHTEDIIINERTGIDFEQ